MYFIMLEKKEAETPAIAAVVAVSSNGSCFSHLALDFLADFVHGGRIVLRFGNLCTKRQSTAHKKHLDQSSGTEDGRESIQRTKNSMVSSENARIAYTKMLYSQKKLIPCR